MALSNAVRRYIAVYQNTNSLDLLFSLAEVVLNGDYTNIIEKDILERARDMGLPLDVHGPQVFII